MPDLNVQTGFYSNMEPEAGGRDTNLNVAEDLDNHDKPADEAEKDTGVLILRLIGAEIETNRDVLAIALCMLLLG